MATPSPSLGPRSVAITFGVPVLLAALARWIHLPGVVADAAMLAVGSRAIGVFALGVAPIFSAYWLVEVVAFLVPRWSRLRHGNPDGRARLDRAVRWVTLVLAGCQGFMAATSLDALVVERGFDHVSVPVVTASLVGGVCVQFVAASWICRQGIANGLVVLFAAGALDEIVQNVSSRLSAGDGEPDLRAIAVSLIATTVCVVATAAALRGAGAAGFVTAPEATDSAYRDAARVAKRPSIPIPAGSFQVYAFATAVLMLPVTMASLGASGNGFRLLDDDRVFLPLLLGLSIVATVVFARFMHRPAELASLAERLGTKAGPEFEAQMRSGIRAALLPSILFLAVVTVSGASSRFPLLTTVALVPIVMDVAHALRTATPDLVPIWEERRAAAVPVLRSALLGHGIATEIRGAYVLNLWQVFAPYAPVQILARAEDAGRADAVLRHLLSGGDPVAAPENRPTTSAVVTPVKSRRNVVLGVCLAAGVGILAVSRLPRHEEVASGPPIKLEIVRVDDTIDPFASVDEPSDPAISLRTESVPTGAAGRYATTHFATLRYAPGDDHALARKRLTAWLARYRLPEGARFGFEEVVDQDPDTNQVTVVGLRTLVLVGASVVTSADVTDAMASRGEPGSSNDAYVAVVLSGDGGRRFEQVSREWLNRRLAIVVDDTVTSAPVVRGVIKGGRISITMGVGSPEVQLADARRLAASLRPRR